MDGQLDDTSVLVLHFQFDGDTYLLLVDKSGNGNHGISGGGGSGADDGVKENERPVGGMVKALLRIKRCTVSESGVMPGRRVPGAIESSASPPGPQWKQRHVQVHRTWRIGRFGNTASTRCRLAARNRTILQAIIEVDLQVQASAIGRSAAVDIVMCTKLPPTALG